MFCSNRWEKKEITADNIWEEARDAAAQYVENLNKQQASAENLNKQQA